MSLTLAQAKVGMSDKVDQTVIDEFRRDSFLLDRLTFDNAVAPGTGGSTLTYGYMQLDTPATAARRAINNEYSAQEAKRTKKTADLDIFGGSFEIDRVIQNTAGAINEIEFQLKEKVKAASSLFHYTVINGNTASTTPAGYVKANFDGIRKLVAGKSTEVSASVDLSTAANAKTNADAFLLALYDWLATFAEKPDMLLMNSKMLARMSYVARIAGYYGRTEDAFGRNVDTFDGIALVDAGQYYNGTSEVDCVATDTSTGATSILGIKLGLDGFHGISPVDNSAIVKTYLPDMNQPGAVKKGEAELVAGVVLKNTRKAGALNGIQIQAKSGS